MPRISGNRNRIGQATLDVVTINLWGTHGPAAARMSDLAAWLGRERPDVVLLQEVEDVDGASQAHLLAETAGYDHVDVVRTKRGILHGEGLAVLSHHPLHPLPSVKLPPAALDPPRGLQQVDVDAPAGTVRVSNTHLAWRLHATAARARQAQAIVRALPSASQPVVVGGDLNDVPGSAPLAVLEQAGLVDCCTIAGQPQATFDRDNDFLWQPDLADRRVDHLLARGLELVDARVVLDGSDGPVVSDHYGVLARMST